MKERRDEVKKTCPGLQSLGMLDAGHGLGEQWFPEGHVKHVS